MEVNGGQLVFTLDTSVNGVGEGEVVGVHGTVLANKVNAHGVTIVLHAEGLTLVSLLGKGELALDLSSSWKVDWGLTYSSGAITRPGSGTAVVLGVAEMAGSVFTEGGGP